MDTLTALLILAGSLIFLWLWYLFCRVFYQIAEEKGFPEKKYLWLPYWLGIFGMLLVVALPDRGVQKVTMPNGQVQAAQPASRPVELPE